MSNVKAMDLLAEVVATGELQREAYDLHCRIEEFITQPAAGDPVAWMYDTPNNGRQYSDKRLDHYWWDALKDSYVKGVPLYAAPPAAAHGDEAVPLDLVKRAAAPVVDGEKMTLDRIQASNDLRRIMADAAMRAQGDGGGA